MDETLTIRDHFAIAAMPLAESIYSKGVPEYTLRIMFGGRSDLTREEIIAALAYAQADAVLKARKVRR